MLSGLEVLELSTMAAAPAACAVLADLGARVVKVEAPFGGGDAWRSTGRNFGPKAFGAMFEQDNRGKSSITLDLQTDAGSEVFHKLLERADLFVTNVRLQGLNKLGLEYEQLQARYPRLIYCHLTAWGRTGPRVSDPGYDTGAYGAATGIMDQQRPSDAADMSRWPVGVGDHAASMSLVGGIGLALHHRHMTGQGQLVDVSLLRAGIWANSHSVVAASASEQWARTLQEPMPLGGRPLLLQPYGAPRPVSQPFVLQADCEYTHATVATVAARRNIAEQRSVLSILLLLHDCMTAQPPPQRSGYICSGMRRRDICQGYARTDAQTHARTHARTHIHQLLAALHPPL